MLLVPSLAAAQEMGTVERVVTHLGDRPSGHMALRFIIQPIVAALLAFRDGTRDARGPRTARPMSNGRRGRPIHGRIS